MRRFTSAVTPHEKGTVPRTGRSVLFYNLRFNPQRSVRVFKGRFNEPTLFCVHGYGVILSGTMGICMLFLRHAVEMGCCM